MARSTDKDPLKIFRFMVIIPGGTNPDTVAGFYEVNGLEMTMAVDENRGGNQNDAPQVSPGLPSFGEVTFRRGQVIDPDNQQGASLFKNWAAQAYHYQAHGYADVDCRRDVKILQLRRNGVVAATTEIVEAFVSYFKPFSDLNGGESGNSIEELRIRHEGFGDPDGIPPPTIGGSLSQVLGLN